MVMPFGLWARIGQGITNSIGVQIPHGKGNFFGERGAHCKVYGVSAVSCAKKLLNRSICHLGCGLWWAEESTSSIVFARWRQCALVRGHIGDIWRIRLNHPSAAAMRPYVKLV